MIIPLPSSRLVILLQRRKKYKSRTILGYKTLAEGVIRMDAVLQKSMDMIIELTASGKNGRPGTVVACLRAERVSSIPVDHDNKNNNSVLLAGESYHCGLALPCFHISRSGQATYCQIPESSSIERERETDRRLQQMA